MSQEADAPIERAAIEDELRRILATEEFQKSRTATQFLKFIVAETIEGRGSRLKAFTIATMALDRAESFDPQNNSLVRVQAMRLRQLLDDYYAGAGAADPVRIVLSPGGYAPQFERNAATAAPSGRQPLRLGRSARISPGPTTRTPHRAKLASVNDPRRRENRRWPGRCRRCRIGVGRLCPFSQRALSRRDRSGAISHRYRPARRRRNERRSRRVHRSPA